MPGLLTSKQRANAKHRLWFRMYRSRMDAGYEQCRNVGCANLATTFGHIVAASEGGPYSPANLTLLCGSCNSEQDDRHWPWLLPLAWEPDYAEIVHYGSHNACGGC